MLLNFFIIGAMKSGTSSIYHLLKQHPDVFMSNPKEPNFFSKNEVYKLGWDWYESLFANAEGKLAIGEASANYSRRDVFPHSR